MHLVRSCLLALTLLATVGCGSSQRFRIPPGEQVADLASVGLRAEITEIVNSKRKLQVHMQLENEGTEELRFKRAGVSLELDGRRHEARDLRVWEIDVDVLPGQVKSKSWAFHVGELVAAGTYDMTITGIETYADDVRTPTGLELVVPVTVPGG